MGGTWTKDEISADANLSNNCSCTKWETRTPGKMIGDTLSKAVGTDIDWLVGADEWGEYLGAIADAAINRIFREGLTSLKGEGSSGQTGAGITYPVSGSTLNASPYEDAVKNKTLGVKLNEQLLLLKENQEKLVSDYQTSLSVLNDTKTAQIDGLTAIKDILAKQACSLPSSVSLSVLSSQSLISCPPLVSTCGCTKDTLKVTAANVGEATIERTLSLCGDYLGGSSSIINSSPAASATVSQLENQISTRQTQVAKIALAIVNLSDYLKKIDEYNIAYENWKNGSGTQNAATLAETAMWTAKTKALSSLQDFFNTTVSDLQQLLTKAQQLSQQTIQEYGDSQIKRGVSGYCGYNTGDTYYQSLCKAQSAKSSLQTALSSCLAL